MTPTRIAYVLNIFPKISETFIAGELAELRRRGVKVRILSLLPPRDEPQHEIIRRAGLHKLVEYDPGRFAAALKEFQPRLIHAHFAREATAAARELSALTGVPFTFTAHGYDIHRKPPPDFRARAEAASAVVTVSEANRDYLEREFGVSRERICVIPCGVDTERFCPGNDDLRSSAGRDVPLVVCVARQVSVKNLGFLLEACAELRRRAIPFRCVMIGDGPLNAELRARRTALKLDEHLEMPGAATQEEVLNWWQRASVGVLTSENEGMPVCLMEAAACGVPVVATRVGGIPELVEQGITGVLSPPGDVMAFAAALEMLLKDSALRDRMSRAARERALEAFSVVRQVDALLKLWSEVLSARQKSLALTLVPSTGKRAAGRVNDPFAAAGDPDLPTLAAALDFERVREAFKRAFPTLGAESFVRPKAIRVVRHKPGRRAVVEYDARLRKNGMVSGRLTLIGKVRARRYGNEGLRLQEAFWHAGLNPGNADGIAVPEPLGVIPEFRMWFQRKVTGRTAEQLFAQSNEADNIALARRVAEAIHKLHHCGVPTEKTHSMEDELRILHECFAQVATQRPGWADRLVRLQRACGNLAASVPPPRACGIHRDFYPAQVIVDGPRLWLLDFDLYCQGDPALDAGNFIGHLTEQALRERGDARAFEEVERALEGRFVELSGATVSRSVQAFATLTLARHVFLSTRFPGRAHLTESLLDLCEQRLG